MSNILFEDFSSLKRTLNSNHSELQSSFCRALDILSTALSMGKKLITFGNGGSASDAEHFVAEIIGRFGFDRSPLPAIAISGASPAFSAIANDYGYENVFERQIRGLGQKGDVAVGISTSGKSKNVLLALTAAKSKGLLTIALTGQADSPIADIADVTLRAPSFETPRIQEIHITLIHSLCRAIEASLFSQWAKPNLPAEKIIPHSSTPQFSSLLAPFKTVFTNGCFDVLHPGHIFILQKCRAMGDLLIVGLNSDESVRRLKGENRPFFKLVDRANMLAAISAVDYIISFEEDNPLSLISRLSPNILVKGGDYKKEEIVGAEWVEAHGGEVRVVPLLEAFSTTSVLNNCKV